MVDGSGFVRRSEVMAGNIVEGEVLQGTLKRLEVPAGALIVMDCGAATEKNLKWLREQGVPLSGGEPRMAVLRQRLQAGEKRAGTPAPTPPPASVSEAPAYGVSTPAVPNAGRP